ncbi:MAG: hypothetical protein QM621_10005 [Aeromicrobium sp.]|uniref:hypothetical protein n=1 Tax=Aeromicrobium sp. TaxID=1871063 RepID=UPI0039E36FB0
MDAGSPEVACAVGFADEAGDLRVDRRQVVVRSPGALGGVEEGGEIGRRDRAPPGEMRRGASVAGGRRGVAVERVATAARQRVPGGHTPTAASVDGQRDAGASGGHLPGRAERGDQPFDARHAGGAAAERLGDAFGLGIVGRGHRPVGVDGHRVRRLARRAAEAGQAELDVRLAGGEVAHSSRIAGRRAFVIGASSRGVPTAPVMES